MAYRTWIALLFGCMAPFLALADEKPNGMTVELNTIIPDESQCRLIYRIENNTGIDLEALKFEAVFFDKEGIVSLLTTFGFKAVPQNSERVSQFRVKLPCDKIERILVNAISECKATQASICEGIEMTSKSEIEITS